MKHTFAFAFLLIISWCSLLPAEKIPCVFKHNSLKKSYQELVTLGCRLSDEGAYSEALEHFKQAASLKPNASASLQGRMALLYYLLNEDEKVIELLNASSLLKKKSENLLLISLAYKNIRNYKCAEKYLLRYLETPNAKHREEALLALAEVKAMQGQSAQAEKILQPLFLTNPSERVLLAFSKLLISRGRFDEAEQILRENTLNGVNLPLFAYLMGEIALNREHYEQALELFFEAKASLPKRTPLWMDQLTESEAVVHISLADSEIESFNRLSHCLTARECLSRLPHRTESSMLLWAQYAVLVKKLIGDEAPLAEVERLAAAGCGSETLTLLIRGVLASSYEEKERLFKKLTTKNPEDPYVQRGWYLRGVNEYEVKKQDPAMNRRALYAFEQAMRHARRRNPALALKALQAALVAALEENSRQSLKYARSLLEEAEGARTPLLLYYEGLVYDQSDENQSHPEYSEHAIRCWESIPRGSSVFPLALFAKSKSYFKRKQWHLAKSAFSDLIESTNHDELFPESHSLIAHCEENLGENPLQTWQALLDGYPDSPFAAEAYYFLVPESDYQRGTPDALHHLNDLTQRFPESPWSIEANLFLGLNAKRDIFTSSGKLYRSKDLEKSSHYLKKVNDIFHNLDNTKCLRDHRDYYFALSARATIERATVDLDIAESAEGTKKQIYQKYAIDLLTHLLADLKEPNLVDESQYLLALAYEKSGDDLKAETLYEAIVNRFHSKKTTRGHYLALSLGRLGRLHQKKHQIKSALTYFKGAADAGQGKVLNSDQYLEILIEQSHCYLLLGDEDLAMTTLSKVINEDAASSLRLKAMFLRSQIYKQQGREELALRQLEALSNQHGEWAAKAQQELLKP